MTPKTEISESEWIAALGSENVRSFTPPAGSKTISEIASLWVMGAEQARRRITRMVEDGTATRTMVGARFYYNLVPQKQKSKC